MSSCEACGKRAEKTPNGTVHQGHHIGCRNARKAPEARAVTRESECLKDGCTEPRVVSKGPRPAKYCEAHKTQRSK